MNADKPQSFELMLDMLEDFKHMCVSKMILGCFQHLTLSHSDIVYKFFNSASYAPYSMSNNFKIVWPDELDEVIFASHTILISEHKLLQEIGEKLKSLSYTGINKFAQNTQGWLSKVQRKDKKKGKKKEKNKKDDNFQKVQEDDEEV